LTLGTVLSRTYGLTMEAGAMTTGACKAVPPPSSEACGKPVTHLVTFSDGDTARVCGSCAMYLDQVAQSHGTKIKVERLT